MKPFLLCLLLSAATIYGYAQANHVLINKVYLAGGEAGAQYTKDYIELFNPTTHAISLTAWTLQYADGPEDSPWNVVTLSGTIYARGYYLIALHGDGAGGDSALPTSDASGSFNLSKTNGKLFLINSSTSVIECTAAGTVDNFGYIDANIGDYPSCYNGDPAYMYSGLGLSRYFDDEYENDASDFTDIQDLTPHNVGAPQTLTVTKTGPGTVTSNYGDINCGTTCSTQLPNDLVVTLTATANAGSKFMGWTSGGCPGFGPCSVTMDQAKTVSALFGPGFPLTINVTGSGTIISTPSGINCGVTCNNFFTGPVSLSASPQPGFIFTGWTGLCSGTGGCSVTMDQARTIGATFIPGFALTVTKTGAGNGEIFWTGHDEACPGTCTSDLPANTIITMQHRNVTGGVWNGWSGACSGTGDCTINMNQVRSVSGNFSKEQLNLTITKAGAGAGTVTTSVGGINCGGACTATYDYGTLVVVTATADPGSVFRGWLGGCDTNPCTVTMNVAKTMRATFAPTTYPIEVTNLGPGTGTITSLAAFNGIINCGATCSGNITNGAVIVLRATAAPGSTFTGWGNSCGTNSNCSFTMDGAKTATATFGLGNFTLTYQKTGSGSGAVTSSSNGGTCLTNCLFTIQNGSTVTLTATADAGNIFTGWSGTGGCTGTGACTMLMNTNKTAIANFSSDANLGVTKTGNGSGTVSSDVGGINCGSSCVQTYSIGTLVTLTATPLAGNSFTGWSGGGCSGTGGCITTIDQSKTITANFIAETFLPLTVTNSGSGTITSNPAGINCAGGTCSQDFGMNSTVNLTAIPDPGAYFIGFTGACSGTGTCSILMDQAKSVTAVYGTTNPLTVTKAGAGAGYVFYDDFGGTCTSVCTNDFPNNISISLRAFPNAGTVFVGWSGACSGTGACVFSMDQARSVIATFEPVMYQLTVTKSGSATGTVTSSSGGVNCGATCISDPVPSGNTVTLTAVPDANSTFSGWSGACSGIGPCTVTMDAAKTVNATFEPGHRLTLIKSGPVAESYLFINEYAAICTGTCSDVWPLNTPLIVRAFPSNPQIIFTGWTGGTCTGTDECSFITDQDRTLQANFAWKQYLLTATKAGNGNGTITSNVGGVNCGATCSGLFNYGTTVTLTAAPAVGTTFTGWTGGGCSGTGGCTVAIDAAKNVTATFSASYYPLSVTKTGTGTGVVAYTGFINCGAVCASSFPNGQAVTLAAIADTGSVFTGWSGACSGSSCTITMDRTRSVIANFEHVTYPVIVTKTGAGSGTVTSNIPGIDCGVDCNEPMEYGTTFTLTATPAPGAVFAGWSGGGCTGTGSCTTTVTGSATIIATFDPLLPNLFVTTPADGATNQKVTVTVTSAIVPGASTYTIELNDAANFNGTSFIKTGGKTQTFTGLFYTTQYYARVKTNLSPFYGKVTTFTTTTPIPIVITPADGAIGQKIALSVTSAVVTGATSYTIELNETPAFNGISFLKTGTSRTQSFSGLKFNTFYYTRVKTNNNPVFGNTTVFKTVAPNVMALSPANGAINQPLNVSVTTSALAGALNYTVELNDAPGFNGNSKVLTGTSKIKSFTGLSYNTLYYVRAKTDLYPFYGSTTTFHTLAPTAYVITPVSGAVNQAINVAVTANMITGATEYTIELNDAANFTGTSFVKIGPARTQSFTGLNYSTKYYTRVKTDLNPSFGTSTSFTTKDAATFSYITSPVDGAINVKWVTAVTANNVPGATIYTIELDTNPDFNIGTTIVKFGDKIQNFDLEQGTVYYARVKTDLGDYGVTRSFTTGTAQGLSYTTTPVDGSSGVPVNVTIYANPLPGATSYNIQLSTTSEFDVLAFDKSAAVRSINFSGLAQSTTYYARVSTSLSPGLFGPTKSFTTNNPAGRSPGNWRGNEEEELVVDASMTVSTYPNPFTDKLEVHVQTLAQEPIRAILMDLTGREIFKSTGWMTNRMEAITGEYSQGVYLLSIQTSNGHKVVRVFKK